MKVGDLVAWKYPLDDTAVIGVIVQTMVLEVDQVSRDFVERNSTSKVRKSFVRWSDHSIEGGWMRNTSLEVISEV